MSMLTSPLLFFHLLVLNKESFGILSTVQRHYRNFRIGTIFQETIYLMGQKKEEETDKIFVSSSSVPRAVFEII